MKLRNKLFVIILAIGSIASSESFADSPTSTHLLCVSQNPRYAGANFAFDFNFNGDAVSYVAHFLGTTHGRDYPISTAQGSITYEDGADLITIKFQRQDVRQLLDAGLSIGNTEKVGEVNGVSYSYFTGEYTHESTADKILCIRSDYATIAQRLGGVFELADGFNY